MSVKAYVVPPHVNLQCIFEQLHLDYGIVSSRVPINMRIQPNGGMIRKHTPNQNKNDLPRLRATIPPA